MSITFLEYFKTAKRFVDRKLLKKEKLEIQANRSDGKSILNWNGQFLKKETCREQSLC